jgi:hypothetical protein
MAEIRVEDILRRLQEHANKENSPPRQLPRADSLTPAAADAREAVERLEANLSAVARARDQLPPLTTRRRGLAARLELWLKRRLKRATHWYTFGQISFNSSVHDALHNVLVALAAHEKHLAATRNRLEAALSSTPAPDGPRTPESESGSGSVEERLASLLTSEVERLRAELREQIELLLDEQRVCFKQLELEIKEAATASDRARRQAQLRLDELADRIKNLHGMRAEIEGMRRATAAHLQKSP